MKTFIILSCLLILSILYIGSSQLSDIREEVKRTNQLLTIYEELKTEISPQISQNTKDIAAHQKRIEEIEQYVYAKVSN